MSAMLQENPCKTVRNSVNNRPPRNDRTQCAISREILGKMNKNEFILFLQFSTLEFCIASHTEKNRNIFAKKIFVKSLFFFIVFYLQFCYSIPAVTEAVCTVYTLLIIFILFLYCQQLKIQVYIEPGARNLNTVHANKTGFR